MNSMFFSIFVFICIQSLILENNLNFKGIFIAIAFLCVFLSLVLIPKLSKKLTIIKNNLSLKYSNHFILIMFVSVYHLIDSNSMAYILLLNTLLLFQILIIYFDNIDKDKI